VLRLPSNLCLQHYRGKAPLQTENLLWPLAAAFDILRSLSNQGCRTLHHQGPSLNSQITSFQSSPTSLCVGSTEVVSAFWTSVSAIRLCWYYPISSLLSWHAYRLSANTKQPLLPPLPWPEPPDSGLARMPGLLPYQQVAGQRHQWSYWIPSGLQGCWSEKRAARWWQVRPVSGMQIATTCPGPGDEENMLANYTPMWLALDTVPGHHKLNLAHGCKAPVFFATSTAPALQPLPLPIPSPQPWHLWHQSHLGSEPTWLSTSCCSTCNPGKNPHITDSSSHFLWL
jgi:hypothetical protein